MTVVAFFTFGILIWFIPYTILAVGLGIWSNKKSDYRMAKVFAFSPLMMTILVAVEVLVFSLATSDAISSDFGASVTMVSLLSIPFGYAIILIVAVAYKLLQSVNFMARETEIPPEQLP